MKLRKGYTFLYMPDDHGHSRQFRIPRWWLYTAVTWVAFVGCLALLYLIGLPTGNGWRPGGSPLQKEKQGLLTQVDGLKGQIGELRGEIDLVYSVQNKLASAMQLEPLDLETFAAGIGGRSALDYSTAEMPGLELITGGQAGFGDLGADLGQMLRQARIQKQGYLAMVDTLDSRDEVRQHIPSIRPVDIGWISSRFGRREDPFTGKQTFHHGLDFSLPLGTPVRATGYGQVVLVQRQRGLGQVIKIDHGNGIVTVYAHLDEVLVKKGARVQRGDLIGKSGNSGRSTAPHLHYEIRIGGRPVNPLSYILDSYASLD